MTNSIHLVKIREAATQVFLELEGGAGEYDFTEGKAYFTKPTPDHHKHYVEGKCKEVSYSDALHIWCMLDGDNQRKLIAKLPTLTVKYLMNEVV